MSNNGFKLSIVKSTCNLWVIDEEILISRSIEHSHNPFKLTDGYYSVDLLSRSEAQRVNDPRHSLLGLIIPAINLFRTGDLFTQS
jgi:hypothetical protein